MSHPAAKFYESYTFPKAPSRIALGNLRRLLFACALSDVNSAVSYLDPASPAVTIRIETPVLRSSTPRQLVKRMNDVMKPNHYFRNSTTKGRPGGNPLMKARCTRPQEEAEVPYRLTKMGVAQKKIEHHALVNGVLLEPSLAEESKSAVPSPSDHPLFQHRGGEALFGHSPVRTWKQRAKTALIYVRTVALDRKSQLRASAPVVPKSANPSPVHKGLGGKLIGGEDYRSTYYAEQSGSASSSSTNSPESEGRLRPGTFGVPKIRLISATEIEGKTLPSSADAGFKVDELKEESMMRLGPSEQGWGSSPLGKLTSNRKREKQRRLTGQAKTQAQFLSTFEISMERLAYEHVVNNSANDPYNNS